MLFLAIACISGGPSYVFTAEGKFLSTFVHRRELVDIAIPNCGLAARRGALAINKFVQDHCI